MWDRPCRAKHDMCSCTGGKALRGVPLFPDEASKTCPVNGKLKLTNSSFQTLQLHDPTCWPATTCNLHAGMPGREGSTFMASLGFWRLTCQTLRPSDWSVSEIWSVPLSYFREEHEKGPTKGPCPGVHAAWSSSPRWV